MELNKAKQILKQIITFNAELLWTAPELLRREHVGFNGSQPGDVYSFAIILHQMFYHTSPYGPSTTAADAIIDRVTNIDGEPFRPRVSSPPLMLVFALFVCLSGTFSRHIRDQEINVPQ